MALWSLGKRWKMGWAGGGFPWGDGIASSGLVRPEGPETGTGPSAIEAALRQYAARIGMEEDTVDELHPARLRVAASWDDILTSNSGLWEYAYSGFSSEPPFDMRDVPRYRPPGVWGGLPVLKLAQGMPSPHFPAPDRPIMAL